jgi:hypothetical protein
MFMESVLSGLALLLNWQVWLVILLYVLINFGFMYICGLAMGRDGRGMFVGCLSYMIGGTILHAALISIAIAFLLPIMLGGNQLTPLNFIISNIGSIIIAGGAAVLGSMVISFIPIIGRVLDQIPGFEEFVEGIIVFRILSDSVIKGVLSKARVTVDVYPGFWDSVGFLTVGVICFFCGVFLLDVLQKQFNNTTADESYMFLTTPFVGIMSGMLPLFMYASYISHSVMQVLGK